MKQQWSPYELEEFWSLSLEEKSLLVGRSGSNRLGFAVLLKFFQIMGHFPQERTDIPKQAVEHLADQLGVPASEFDDYGFSDRLLRG
jgi:hypothetical protein